MSATTTAYLKLARPANSITAVADILLGVTASGLILHRGGWTSAAWTISNPSPIPFLILSTICLYSGSVVYNDVFDAELDRRERPERPIPSGLMSRRAATIFGTLLLAIGILATIPVSSYSVAIAILVTSLAILYNAIGKHHPSLGPLTMGFCRGGNLLLGMSAFPPSICERGYLVLIPILYVLAITMISRGEVSGGSSTSLTIALGIYSVVLLAVATLGLSPFFDLRPALPFLFLFGILVVPPVYRAMKVPSPQRIQAAVRLSVLAIIILDSAVAAGIAGWGVGLVVASLLPVSLALAKYFAVT